MFNNKIFRVAFVASVHIKDGRHMIESIPSLSAVSNVGAVCIRELDFSITRSSLSIFMNCACV